MSLPLRASSTTHESCNRQRALYENVGYNKDIVKVGKNEQQSRKARIFWKKKDLFFQFRR